MPEYTLLTGVAIVGVVLLELCWFRTGIFGSLQYWVITAIAASRDIAAISSSGTPASWISW